MIFFEFIIENVGATCIAWLTLVVRAFKSHFRFKIRNRLATMNGCSKSSNDRLQIVSAITIVNRVNKNHSLFCKKRFIATMNRRKRSSMCIPFLFFIKNRYGDREETLIEREGNRCGKFYM